MHASRQIRPFWVEELLTFDVLVRKTIFDKIILIVLSSVICIVRNSKQNDGNYRKHTNLRIPFVSWTLHINKSGKVLPIQNYVNEIAALLRWVDHINVVKVLHTKFFSSDRNKKQINSCFFVVLYLHWKSHTFLFVCSFFRFFFFCLEQLVRHCLRWS